MSKETTARTIKDSRERRREEAARWFVVLPQAELTPRVLKSWKKWESVPANREAFDAIERIWGLADSLPPPWPSAQEQAADQYDGSEPVSSWRSRQTPQPARARRCIVLAAAPAIAAAVLASVAAWMALVFFGSASPHGRHVSAETAVAEHKELVLEDGSRIYLGAQTLVTTTFTGHARTVVLHRGEALFEVAKDRDRPFRVDAGRGNVVAVGTAFNVRRRADDQVVVTVTEGVVEVSPTPSIEQLSRSRSASGGNDSPPARRVIGGQEIRVDTEGRLSPIRATEASMGTTWRDGRLTYRSEPLRYVIEDLNRYSRRQVILGDPATGDLLYSGTVFEQDIDDWIVALGKVYPGVEVVATDDRHVLIRARSDTAGQR